MTPKNYLLHVLLVHLVGLYCSVSGYPQSISLDLRKYPRGYRLKSHSYNSIEPRPMSWTLTGPWREQLEIRCSISLIKRAGCSEGVLTISGIGSGQVNLCNKIPSYNRVSFGNQIVVKYKTGPNKLGYFDCLVRVVEPGRETSLARHPYHVGSSSRQQYQGAQKTSCPCGQTNRRRIMGGQDTGANEYPFAAYLKTRGDAHGFCGGSVITKRHILTAAHCVDKNHQNTQVVVGGHDVRTDQRSPVVQTLNVESVHAGMRSGKLNDIAVLYLSGTIDFNDYVRPVCLPTERYPLVGRTITALGWGRLAFNLPVSDTLQSVDLEVIDTTICARHDRYRGYRIKVDKFLCTSTQHKDKDTCKGDSGGPLIHWDSELNSWVQVGLVTFGGFGSYGADEPSCHTLIYSYFDWIQNFIDPDWKLRRMTSSGVPHQGTTANNGPQFATCEKIEVFL